MERGAVDLVAMTRHDFEFRRSGANVGAPFSLPYDVPAWWLAPLTDAHVREWR